MFGEIGDKQVPRAPQLMELVDEKLRATRRFWWLPMWLSWMVSIVSHVFTQKRYIGWYWITWEPCMFHAISHPRKIQQKRKLHNEQVFGWFLTADECPRYGRRCVAALEAVSKNFHPQYPERNPSPNQTNIKPQLVFWICLLTVGGLGKSGVCSNGEVYRSINLLRYLFLRRIDPSAVEGIPLVSSGPCMETSC